MPWRWEDDLLFKGNLWRNPCVKWWLCFSFVKNYFIWGNLHATKCIYFKCMQFDKYIYSHESFPLKITENFHHHKKVLCASFHSVSVSTSRTLSVCFGHYTLVLPFLEHHRRGITQYVLFCVCFFPIASIVFHISVVYSLLLSKIHTDAVWFTWIINLLLDIWVLPKI